MAEESSDEIKIPACPPLVNQHYSLAPDMYFGWKPKNLSNGAPVPIQFFEEELPHAIDPATNEEFPAVYYGFRPTDSLVLHKELSRNYPFSMNHPLMSAYEFISARNSKRPIYISRPFQGPKRLFPGLHFDSQFECGNLDKAVMISEDEYDLYIRSDTNTTWHYQWFYFAVTKVARERTVKFNIVNCSRNNTLFERGMQPVGRVGESGVWERVGDNLRYELSKINRFLKRGRFMMLSFQYHFSGKEQVMYFAESAPYSYSQSLGLLSDLRREHPSLVSKSVLCKTLGGIEVPILTITNPAVAEACKKYIVITSRVHPSETVASWKMEGFLRFLCSSHPQAETLRDRFTFKVVPMLNPDGVVIGNSRTSLTGEDMNRQFLAPDPSLYPVNSHLLSLIESLTSKGRTRVLSYIDMHGHSKRKGCFMYGPYFPLHNENYFKIRVIPKLFSEMTAMFRYYSCQFRFENYKRGSARIVMCKEFGITMSFTIETSLYGYINSEKQTVPYSVTDLKELGAILGDCLVTFDEMMREEKQARQRRAKQRGRKTARKREQSSHSINAREKDVSVESFTGKTPGTPPKTARNYRDMVKDMREDESLEKPPESPCSGSESGEEDDEESKAFHENILRTIQEFRIMASDAPTNDESADMIIKSCKASAKHTTVPSKRKSRGAILPNISILRTPKEVRTSIDSSGHKKWGPLRAEHPKKIEKTSSQNSFCNPRETLQESVLHDEHIKEASECVTQALKMRAQRNLSGMSYSEIRKRNELAPATIQELQKRLAMLLVNEEVEEITEMPSRELRKSYEGAKSTHSTDELRPMDVLEGRKRSPQVKDLMRPRGEHAGNFPDLKRRPSLRKTEASPYSRFGPFSALPLLNPSVLK